MEIQVQEDTLSAVDTLSSSYSDQWDAAEGVEQSGMLIQMMASNDLIFIVLTVSLIIWFTLLYFIIRVDKKVAKLEQQIDQHSTTETNEA